MEFNVNYSKLSIHSLKEIIDVVTKKDVDWIKEMEDELNEHGWTSAFSLDIFIIIIKLDNENFFSATWTHENYMGIVDLYKTVAKVINLN